MNTLEQHDINVSEAQYWIERFDWLTTRMLADIMFSDKSQKMTLAQRLVKSMVADKLIYPVQLKCGIKAYSTKKKPNIENEVHRSVSNWYLIEKMNQGFTVLTEYEIISGNTNYKQKYGKVPDGWVITDFGDIWVEVENAWKNKAERQKIVDFCNNELNDNYKANIIFRVAIVANGVEPLNHMLNSIRDNYDNGVLTDRQVNRIDAAILTVNRSLVPDEMLEMNLHPAIL